MAKFLPVSLLLLALAVCVFASDTFYYAALEGGGSLAGRSGSAFLVVLQGSHNVQGYYLHNANVTLKATYTIKTETSQRTLGSLVKSFKSSSSSASAVKGLGANSFSFSIAGNRAVAEGIWNGSLTLNLTQSTTGFLSGQFRSAQNVFFANLNGSQNVPALTTKNTTANGFGFVQVDTTGADDGLIPRRKVNKGLSATAWIYNSVTNSVSGELVQGAPSVGNVNATDSISVPADSINGTNKLTRFFGGSFDITRKENTGIQNGKSFLLVSSEKNPTGDVRGQLIPFSSVGALLTGLGGGKLASGLASPNYGATRSADLAGPNFDSEFAMTLVPDQNTGIFDGTFFWKLPSNLEREAFGRASFPLVSVQGVRILFNLQIKTDGVAYAGGDYVLTLVPKSSAYDPLVIAQFNGYKRKNAAGFQRFEHAYIDIDGTTLSNYLQPNRKLKVRITYSNSDNAGLHIDQLAIQVAHGNKPAVRALRSLDLVPSASSLLPN